MTKEQETEYRDRVVVEAKKMFNTPFCHRGRTKYGVDCLGFGWKAFLNAGLEMSFGPVKNYEKCWYLFADKETYLDGLLRYFDYIENPIPPNWRDYKSFPLPADIITFKCFGKARVTHGAIYIGGIDFIHAPSGGKVRIDNLENRYWNKVFHAFLRYRGFTETGVV